MSSSRRHQYHHQSACIEVSELVSFFNACKTNQNAKHRKYAQKLHKLKILLAGTDGDVTLGSSFSRQVGQYLDSAESWH